VTQVLHLLERAGAISSRTPYMGLYATHIALSLLTALLCLRVDTRPALRR